MHHRGKRATSSGPVRWVLVGQVFDAGHVSVDTLADEDSGVETQRVAVLRVKVAGQGTPAFVSEKVTLREELTRVIIFRLA